MAKIKSLSQYDESAWSDPIPIGADAINIDVTTDEGIIVPLSEVLDNKLDENGDLSNTVVQRIEPIDPSDISTDISSEDTMAIEGLNQTNLWRNFNKLRQVLINRKDVSIIENNLSSIQRGNTLIFNLGNEEYFEISDTIELYINGLKTNPLADNYSYEFNKNNNTIIFTFNNSISFTNKDVGELVIRR